MSDPYPLPCPNCGHRFSLADLKTMAVGDGFRRFIFVEIAGGKIESVDFNDYNPATMKVVETKYGDVFNSVTVAHHRFTDSVAAMGKDHESRKG